MVIHHCLLVSHWTQTASIPVLPMWTVLLFILNLLTFSFAVMINTTATRGCCSTRNVNIDRKNESTVSLYGHSSDEDGLVQLMVHILTFVKISTTSRIGPSGQRSITILEQQQEVMIALEDHLKDLSTEKTPAAQDCDAVLTVNGS